MQSFKQIPYQNYIQLRFNNKNLNEVTQEQTLLKYKRNAAILAKIFSFKRGDQQDQIPISEQKRVTITPQIVEKFEDEVKKQEQNYKIRIEEAEQRSKLFDEIIKTSQKIKNKEQLFEILQKLKKNKMYDQTHPYLNQSSPFYLNSTVLEILPVQNKHHIEKSNFNESSMIFEEIQ